MKRAFLIKQERELNQILSVNASITKKEALEITTKSKLSLQGLYNWFCAGFEVPDEEDIESIDQLGLDQAICKKIALVNPA